MNNRIVEDAIEVHTPDGIRMIAMPAECSVARVGAMVLHLMECAGYEPTRSERGAAFAFAPKVYEDEVAETPFDTESRSLCERLSLIPGTRVHFMQRTPTGLMGRLTDYGSGRTLDMRLDEVQPELQDVPNEALRRSKERTNALRLKQHDGSELSPVPPFAVVRVAYIGDTDPFMDERFAHATDWAKVAWYTVVNEGGRAVEAVNGRA